MISLRAVQKRSASATVFVWFILTRMVVSALVAVRPKASKTEFLPRFELLEHAEPEET